MALGKELGRIPAGLHPPGHSSGAAAGSLSSTAGDSSQEGTVTLGQCGTGRGAAFGSTRSRRKGDAEFLQSEPSPWCSPWVPAGLCPHPSPRALLPWGSPGPPAPLPAAGTSSACKPRSGCKNTNPKSPNPSGSSADSRALLTRAQGTSAQEIWL